MGNRIVVAWSGSRESVRAVSDAMPFLRRAKEVIVLAINPRHGPDGHGDIPAADISLHLARHGVRADAQDITTDQIEVGDVLLSRAADESADLVVMGAYGHSRFRELILGGATRHLLQHMTVPILMSH
jgi:nucleotide-binding universal stress UspA family protein